MILTILDGIQTKENFDIDERLTGPLPKIEENEVINKVSIYQ